MADGRRPGARVERLPTRGTNRVARRKLGEALGLGRMLLAGGSRSRLGQWLARARAPERNASGRRGGKACGKGDSDPFLVHWVPGCQLSAFAAPCPSLAALRHGFGGPLAGAKTTFDLAQSHWRGSGFCRAIYRG
jgi:hypothetical protein